ncbi:MAG: UDP-glucose 4-epimerase GalE [Bacteroidetes bacterium GWE2_41_25]|nr:MAG: UDP-glucose 4-epimerase GalE [Bacteroidetes bacterium GWA2_40_15]OFX95837.1 MAG: UDP-glucose 4-epimerase GalE [Bacteroidetes bacterium GWC2_40_22]OFY11353.1 MAG: UDP-glucose 4-epimerase GalE [Bacteroidetes bacterium GWE2_41_25]HAM10924.1 UDP-glucose 4-epimerase GalE [Bacteroidales bacterium]HBH83091.1 UDP-glucose 4-epimerase GalE [Bacteroidales bacterium]
MKKKILVTGGTGYIGSHTAIELINEEFDVAIIDNLYNSEKEVIDGIEKISGKRPSLEIIDICDMEKLDGFFSRNKEIAAIIHFAAYKAVSESVSKPLEYYRNNLVSLINLLGLMKKYRIANLVFSSSCTVYGQPENLPVTEDAPLQPATSPYGNTKAVGEEIIRDTVFSDSSIRAIALRYFNPIGAHASALIGELPRGVPENLVPYITQTAYGLRDELKVFGNDYDTPDGYCIRDYLHVVDLAKAHVVAVKRLIEEKNKSGYEVFNLGTGNGVSVLEAIKSFERVSGVKLKYKVTGRRPGDIEKIWADPSFANRELGWKTISTLDEAMKTAWDWENYIRSKSQIK